MEPLLETYFDGVTSMKPLWWSHFDGATSMEPFRWSHFDGATSMEPLRWSHFEWATSRDHFEGATLMESLRGSHFEVKISWDLFLGSFGGSQILSPTEATFGGFGTISDPPALFYSYVRERETKIQFIGGPVELLYFNLLTLWPGSKSVVPEFGGILDPYKPRRLVVLTAFTSWVEFVNIYKIKTRKHPDQSHFENIYKTKSISQNILQNTKCK